MPRALPLRAPYAVHEQCPAPSCRHHLGPRLAPKVLRAIGGARSCRWIDRDLGIGKNTVAEILKRHRPNPQRKTPPLPDSTREGPLWGNRGPEIRPLARAGRASR